MTKYEDAEKILQIISDNTTGKLANEKAELLLVSYYEKYPIKTIFNIIVELRIKRLIDTLHFDFSKEYLCSIHEKLFTGLLKDAGQFRKLFLTKKEPLLNDESIFYANYNDINMLLDYDFNLQKEKSPTNALKSLSKFIANIWQVHPFMDGNTRTLTVFLYGYLKSLGYSINKDILITSIPYLRDALVIANQKVTNQGENYSYVDTYLEKITGNESIELDRSSIKKTH